MEGIKVKEFAMQHKLKPPKSSFHDIVDWFSKLFGPVGSIVAVLYGKVFKLKPEKQDEFNLAVSQSVNESKKQLQQLILHLRESGYENGKGRNSNGTFTINKNGYIEFETKLTIGPSEGKIELVAPIQFDKGGYESITTYGDDASRITLGVHEYDKHKCYINVRKSVDGTSNEAIARGSGWLDIASDGE